MTGTKVRSRPDLKRIIKREPINKRRERITMECGHSDERAINMSTKGYSAVCRECDP